MDRDADLVPGLTAYSQVPSEELHPAELARVQGQFGLHELAVEDAQTLHLRPKIERYEEGNNVLFAVFRTARYNDEREEIEFGEVSVFVSSRFVITVRQGEASGFTRAIVCPSVR